MYPFQEINDKLSAGSVDSDERVIVFSWTPLLRCRSICPLSQLFGLPVGEIRITIIHFNNMIKLYMFCIVFPFSETFVSKRY